MTTPAPAAPIYPCDRCTEVRPVYPCRPGELLCGPCAVANRPTERRRPMPPTSDSRDRPWTCPICTNSPCTCEGKR